MLRSLSKITKHSIQTTITAVHILLFTVYCDYNYYRSSISYKIELNIKMLKTKNKIKNAD